MPLTRRRLLAGIAGCSLLSALPVLAHQRPQPTTLVNWFGSPLAARHIRRVLSAGPVADILLAALAADKLIGFSRLNLRQSAAFIGSAQLRALPVSGRLTGRGNTLSLERVIALNPDLIIDTGNVNDSWRSLAQRVASQTQIPYLLLDGQLTDTPRQLLALGDILDNRPLARQQAAIAQRFIEQAQQFAARQTHPRRFYSARGRQGLETGLQGSLHTEAIELLGLHNVAQASGRSGLTPVSMEQLLLWQPDILITEDLTSWRAIKQNPLWRGLRAVMQHQLLLFSGLPFGWLDSPPGINRLLGLRRLQAQFDPTVRASLADDARAFFRLFLHHDISLPQWQHLIAEPAT